MGPEKGSRAQREAKCRGPSDGFRGAQREGLNVGDLLKGLEEPRDLERG